MEATPPLLPRQPLQSTAIKLARMFFFRVVISGQRAVSLIIMPPARSAAALGPILDRQRVEAYVYLPTQSMKDYGSGYSIRPISF